MKTSDYKSFHYLENGDVQFSNFSTVKSANRLDSGSYKLGYIEYPQYVVTVKLDKDSESDKDPFYFVHKDELSSYFDQFFNNDIQKHIRELGLYHKGGVLLYGKEGTGKTSILKYFYSKFIREKQALVFHIESPKYIESIWKFITGIREIQDNPIIVILDEMDIYTDIQQTGLLKTILDGNLSIHNCMFFGLTNEIEKIPAAIKNRPSRFKYNIEVEGVQSVEHIKLLIKGLLKNSIEEDEINNLSEELKGETLDVIKHKCLDRIMKITQNKTNRIKLGFKI